MAGARTCPECGARVGAYAAGCEHCGADLEAHARRERLAAAAAGPARPERGPSRLATRVRAWAADLGVTRAEAGVVLLALVLLAYLPALALLPIGLAIMHGVFEGRRGWTALFTAMAVVALVLAITG